MKCEGGWNFPLSVGWLGKTVKVKGNLFPLTIKDFFK